MRFQTHRQKRDRQKSVKEGIIFVIYINLCYSYSVCYCLLFLQNVFLHLLHFIIYVYNLHYGYHSCACRFDIFYIRCRNVAGVILVRVLCLQVVRLLLRQYANYWTIIECCRLLRPCDHRTFAVQQIHQRKHQCRFHHYEFYPKK